MKRKRTTSTLARTDGSRTPSRASDTTFRLPTVAALAAMLAMTAVTVNASAIVGTADAGADANDDAAGEDADDDAQADVMPVSCPPMLGGAPPPPQVHGSGCGCGSDRNEGVAGGLAAVGAVAVALAGRRRR